ncbi:Suppressor of lurcher protein 1 [Nymphon striatum]|nr:Suppressor of lurcher protein 1 [Nymphon striatum]
MLELTYLLSVFSVVKHRNFEVCVVFCIFIIVTVLGACQCIIYDKTNGKKYGVFTSPDHPVAYETEIKCLLYTFTADPDEIVKVSFDEFDIQRAKPECIFGDYVKLFLHLDQPMVNEYSPWNRVLCGKIQDIDQIYYSAKNSLIFEFHSDWRNGNNTGFRGTYRFIKKKQYITDGEKVPDTKCDYQFSSSWTNSSRGRFFSPLYPSLFKRGSKCSYRFVGYIHERVRVIFEKVSFEKSDSSLYRIVKFDRSQNFKLKGCCSDEIDGKNDRKPLGILLLPADALCMDVCTTTLKIFVIIFIYLTPRRLCRNGAHKQLGLILRSSSEKLKKGGLFQRCMPELISLSFFHLNISSLYKHLDNFSLLLDSLDFRFQIIGISETRITSNSIPHNRSIEMDSVIINVDAANSMCKLVKFRATKQPINNSKASFES